MNKPGDNNQKPVLDMRELGATGLRRFSGFIFEDFLNQLVGQKGTAVYKEMAMNDPTCSAMLFAIKMLCRRVSWRIKPASDANYDREAADFITGALDDMSQTWNDTVGAILSMLTYGHDVEEIVYKRRNGNNQDPSKRSKFDDGRVGWRKFSTRSQDTLYRWVFDSQGGIQGVQQLAPPLYNMVTIPIEKMLLFRTSTDKNNPEGLSMLRGAYRPWYMKKNIENIEAIGIERDLAGLPVFGVPPELLGSGATPDQKALLNSIQNIVTNIKRDEQEGVVVPLAYDASGKLAYELKLLSTGGARNFDTDKIVQRYDQRIAMTLLADFILLGQNQVGSFALSDSKTEIFASAISAFLDIICEVMNRHAIPRLMNMNQFKISAYPQLEHGDIENIDLAKLGQYISALAGAGYPLFPNPELETFLAKAANMPEPPNAAAQMKAKVETKNTGEGGHPVEIPADEVTQDPTITNAMADFDKNLTQALVTDQGK